MGSQTAGRDEEQRFRGLYESCFDRVAGYLLARTDRDSAADAIGRTFEIAWRRLDDVPAEALPWLLGVARRVLSEQRRAVARRHALIERIGETVPGFGPDHAEAHGARECVLSALGDLSEPQREALLLIAWDGLSQREAAEALGCTRGALALRLHRARGQLRRALGGEGLRKGPRPHEPIKPSTEEAL